MHRRSVQLIGSVAITAVLVTSSLTACAAAPSGPVVALPNSYYLQPDKGEQTQLVRRDGHRILPAHVAAYAVSGQIVAGALGDVASKRLYTNELPFKGESTTRYFILDTSTGKLESDLDLDSWHSRLKTLGVRDDFSIYPLLPWQQ
jgi:hypothetical protein